MLPTDAEMEAWAEADAAAKGDDIDDIRPRDRVVENTARDIDELDDWEDFQRFYDEHVVPEQQRFEV